MQKSSEIQYFKVHSHCQMSMFKIINVQVDRKKINKNPEVPFISFNTLIVL